MSQRKFNFAEGEFYHIYNRGTDKRVIFCDKADHVRFQQLLHIANNKQRINIRDIFEQENDLYNYRIDQRLVSVGAYCLMPNHYHVLATPLAEGALSLFIQKLSTAYSMYFNKKYERTGTLFEGKFKSQLVDDDRYLKYLFSYIHLNPVKLIQKDWKEAGLKDKTAAEDFLKEYEYSSYFEASGNIRSQSVILQKEPFPVYFESISAAEKEIQDWLTFP